MGQPWSFYLDERYRRLCANGDPLVKLAAPIDVQALRPKPAIALQRSEDRRVAGRVVIWCSAL